MSIKIISNQSNEDDIIPNREKLKRHGFEKIDFDILPNNSRKAYEIESENKYLPIDKYFSSNDTIYIPNLYDGVIRIATYNVHNWVTIYDEYNPKRNIDNFKKFFKVLNADIICLQEVAPLLDYELKEKKKLSEVNGYNFKIIVKKMKEIGYNYSAIANNVIDDTFYQKNTNYYILANAIFSRIPFEKEIFHIVGNRSVTIGYFKTKRFNFIVVNTHIEYAKKHFNIDRLRNFGSDDIRIIQVNEILELCSYAIEKYNTENIFLIGDFNDNHQSKRLVNIFKRFVSLKLPKITNIFSKSTIDFICPNKATMKNIFIFNYDTIEAKLSDHLPVYLDMIPIVENELIKKLYPLRKILSIDELDSLEYVKDFESNGVTKYVTFKYTDKIIDQYYLNTEHYYFNEKLSEMYKVDRYDYVSLVKKLIKINEYYNGYKNIAKYYNGKMIKITKETRKDKSKIEDMLLQFVKCRSSMKVITVWPAIDFNSKSKEFGDILQTNGDIYYKKEILLDYWGAMSLMYQLYLTTDRNKTFDNLDYNVKQKGWNNNEKKRVIIIFYEHRSSNKIEGTQSDFKTKLRALWKTEEMRPYDILHINDYFQETVDYASLYLNKNSLEILEKQDILNYLKLTSYKEQVYINTLKKTLYGNFKQEEIINFIFYSSIVLYIYGLRKFNDIDGFVYSEKYGSNFKKNYKDFFDVSRNSFIPFIDISSNISGAYQDYIRTFLDKVAYIVKKIDYTQVIYNPDYHFYFFGMKFHLIEFEIVKRIYRFKPASWADLVMIKEKLNYPIIFPSIPDNIKYYYKKNGLDKDYLLNTIIHYLKKKYNITKSKQEIESMITDSKITTNIDNKNINKDVKFFSKIL